MNRSQTEALAHRAVEYCSVYRRQWALHYLWAVRTEARCVQAFEGQPLCVCLCLRLQPRSFNLLLFSLYQGENTADLTAGNQFWNQRTREPWSHNSVSHEWLHQSLLISIHRQWEQKMGTYFFINGILFAFTLYTVTGWLSLFILLLSIWPVHRLQLRREMYSEQWNFLTNIY